MQASFATIDWLFDRTGKTSRFGSVWKDMSGPIPKGNFQEERLDAVIEQLESLFPETSNTTNPEPWASLRTYLEHSLQIDARVSNDILWEPPRSILLGLVPTALRRLKTRWQKIMPDGSEQKGEDFCINHSPLPDFMPMNLFSDLNLPEVCLTVPAQQRNDDETDEFMPILQALQEFAPGRISKRFGIKNTYARHWLPVEGKAGEKLELSRFINTMESLGEFTYLTDAGDPKTVQCWRPYAISLEKPEDKDLSDSTNAFQFWHSCITASDSVAHFIEPRATSVWSGLIPKIRVHLHRDFETTRVTRFSTGSHGELVRPNGRDKFDVTFVNDGVNAALGFQLEVDGLAFENVLPDDLSVLLEKPEISPALRTERFFFESKTRLQEEGLDPFLTERLYETFFTLVSIFSVRKSLDLVDAAEALVDDPQLRGHMIADLLNLQRFGDAFEKDSKQDSADITEALHDPSLLSAMLESMRIASSDYDSCWCKHLQQRMRHTLGAILLEACILMCPEFDANDLVLDLDGGASDMSSNSSQPVFWITETSVGGGGFVEELVRRIEDNPRLFWEHVSNALSPTDFEVASSELRNFLDECTKPGSLLQNAMASWRDANTHESLRTAVEDLRKGGEREGVYLNHMARSSLFARVLRPGSTDEVEHRLLEVFDAWDRIEANLGFELPVGTITAIECENSKYDVLSAHIPSNGGSKEERYKVLRALVWLRGGELRQGELQFYNPYAKYETQPDRLLVDAVLRGDDRYALEYHEGPDFLSKVSELLVSAGHAKIRVAADARDAVADLLLNLIETPIEVGYLMLFPSIGSFRRHGQLWEIGVVLEGGI